MLLLHRKPRLIVWAYVRKGGGRGFGFTGFHVCNNLDNDRFRATLSDCVA